MSSPIHGSRPRARRSSRASRPQGLRTGISVMSTDCSPEQTGGAPPPSPDAMVPGPRPGDAQAFDAGAGSDPAAASTGAPADAPAGWAPVIVDLWTLPSVCRASRVALALAAAAIF